MAFGVIYKATNRINSKIYVGQTKRTVEERFKEHMESPYPFGKALRFHGIENFTIEVIEECETQEQLNEREKFWIAYFDCMAPKGYNCTAGGKCGSHCEETIEKLRASANAFYEEHPERREEISEEQKKRFSDPEERAKAAERTRKSFENPERVAKQSESQKKRFERQEERDKISAAVTERFSDPAEREAQSARITAYFNTPGAREKNSAAQKKRFEDPAEHEKVSIGVKKYFEEHGTRKHTDKTKEKIRVKRTAYCARVRAEKKLAATEVENRAAAEWEISLLELKNFLSANPIRPIFKGQKARRERERIAKLPIKIAEQNRLAAELVNPLPAFKKFHVRRPDVMKRLLLVPKCYGEVTVPRIKKSVPHKTRTLKTITELFPVKVEQLTLNFG